MTQATPNAIELRLRDVSQLFNTLDPLPFREKDIDPAAERFIVDWATDLPKNEPLHIVIHAQGGANERMQADVSNAIAGWFTAKAKDETSAIRTLFHDGRIAFVVGVALMSLCMFVAWRLSESYSGPFLRIVQESLVIVGWVVMWRPAEMFLYDWVPMVRRRWLFRRLAAAKVTVQASPVPGA